jgi:hypothetical protein
VSTQVDTRPQATKRGRRVLRDGRSLYWWMEVLVIGVFYIVYSGVRNVHGNSLADPPAHALDHAEQIISLQQRLGLFHEATLQDWAQHFTPLIIAANYFYGSLHFIVTIFAGVYLFRRHSDDYPFFRNVLGITTALALIGFLFYPLTPPRLLDHYNLDDWGFSDTLARYPTFWSFNSGGMKSLSNQFAAMPSVHIAWSTWCALALGPRVRHRIARISAWSYPVLTLIVIVITGNHYVLDAAGGLVILGLGWIIAKRITRAGRNRAPAPA